MLHLFVSFQFGKGASIGLGIVEALLVALLLTGLGDRIWPFYLMDGAVILFLYGFYHRQEQI